MHKCFFLSLLFSVHFSFAQTEITWNDLEDVEFEDIFYDEVDEFIAYPHFGQSVMNLSGVEVSLTGYILALDPDEGYYILSKGPFASCFFCGDGGPETIVELELKNKKQYFMMDEIATIKGVLKLNADDIYQCVYILQNAEVSR